MQLFFLHNVPIHVITNPTLLELGKTYNWVAASQPGLVAASPLMGSILLYTLTEQWKQLLHEMSQLPLNKVTSISILLPKTANIDLLLQQYFKPTQSAGGIVTQGENVLMIYRSHMWDLPKGRIESGETSSIAAIREVQEECGVQALVKEAFYTTWHAFQTNQTHFLKETTWYIMDCVDDSQMAPQQEEAIEQAIWVPLTKLPRMFKNTYASIQLLLQAYQNYVIVKKNQESFR
jgi:ADP-ribose pyrophosphatase YjhB (NUDIX family)